MVCVGFEEKKKKGGGGGGRRRQKEEMKEKQVKKEIYVDRYKQQLNFYKTIDWEI